MLLHYSAAMLMPADVYAHDIRAYAAGAMRADMIKICLRDAIVRAGHAISTMPLALPQHDISCR